MRKIFLMVMVFGFMFSGEGWADGYGFHLNAGSTSLSGGFDYKKDLNTGYLRTGIGVVYTDDDDTEYQWVDLKFMVGSQTLAPGLTCEVGLDAIFGDAEENGLSGDVGAIAFAGRTAYLFPRRVMPLPLELFASLSYAPEMLSFRDTKRYIAYTMGIGFRIVENATLYLEYANYDIEMENAPVDWDFDDDVVRLGVSMRF